MEELEAPSVHRSWKEYDSSHSCKHRQFIWRVSRGFARRRPVHLKSNWVAL